MTTPATAKMYVDGAWVDASSKDTFESVNPATGETFATVPLATVDDVNAAVDAARTAFEGEGQLDAFVRGQLLHKVAALIRERRKDIATIEVQDNGKRFSEALGDIDFAAWTFDYYAGLTDKIQGATIPVPGPRLNYTLREPLGVTAHIVPWNFPFQLACRSIAPAIAAGNTVVAKPASWTSLSLLELGKIFEAAGAPKGLFNVITGEGRKVGNALATHKHVEHVVLTGSVETGKAVMKAAADQVTPVTLELGGKSPNVVFPDANLDRAVKGVYYGIFMNAGQMCWAGSRLVVHDSIHDEFVQKLTKMAEGATLGNGLDRETKMGAITHVDHMAKVLDYIETGKNEATLVTGGERGTAGDLAKGAFVKPTIFTDVGVDSTIAREEIFGPVLAVQKFSTDEEALEIANATEFGLYSGVWTSNLQRAHRMAAGIHAGAVAVNEYPVTFPQTPFTGFKASGIGTEQGLTAVDAYTRTKSVLVNLG